MEAFGGGGGGGWGALIIFTLIWINQGWDTCVHLSGAKSARPSPGAQFLVAEKGKRHFKFNKSQSRAGYFLLFCLSKISSTLCLRITYGSSFSFFWTFTRRAGAADEGTGWRVRPEIQSAFRKYGADENVEIRKKNSGAVDAVREAGFRI